MFAAVLAAANKEPPEPQDEPDPSQPDLVTASENEGSSKEAAKASESEGKAAPKFRAKALKKKMKGLAKIAGAFGKKGAKEQHTEVTKLKGDLEDMQLEAQRPLKTEAAALKSPFATIEPCRKLLVDLVGQSGVLWERRGERASQPERVTAKCRAETAAECIEYLTPITSCLDGILERHRYKLQVLYESNQTDPNKPRTLLDTLTDLTNDVKEAVAHFDEIVQAMPAAVANWAADDGLPTSESVAEPAAEDPEKPVEQPKTVYRIKKNPKMAKLEDEVIEDLITVTIDKLPLVLQSLNKRAQSLDAKVEDLTEEVEDLKSQRKALQIIANKGQEWRLAYETLEQQSSKIRRRSTLEGLVDIDEEFQKELQRAQQDCQSWKHRAEDLESQITMYLTRLHTDVSQALNISEGMVFPAFLRDRFATVPHPDDSYESKTKAAAPAERERSPSPTSLSARERVVSNRPGSAPMRRLREREQPKTVLGPSRNVVTLAMPLGKFADARLEMRKRRVLVGLDRF